ncbi:hypothetical protein [Halorarum halobium]|uniref:DUF7857 domain-containing protein n=1 Tax=Halorarum halobium TaxID=3075121 RepID=UPI0028B02DE9|nr:hypothetical protein [Halobaculum sp. XH14]
MSVSLSADATVAAGVALVSLDVRNPTPVARQVRIVNRLDGPVLPPRRNGVPETGWDEDGVTAVLDAGESISLGYACPLGEREATVPTAKLADVGDPDGSREAVATRARRELGAFRPPRDAVPDGTALDVVPPRDGHESGASEPDATVPDLEATVPERKTTETERTVAEDLPPSAIPDSVLDWLEDAATRIELAERLTDASVADATDALADGDRDPKALPLAVEADAEALRSVGERTETLAGRAEATDVPVDALGRLA